MLPPPHRPATWRLLVFAGGDFAFNLYWQSMMLYLLFYTTEAMHLPLGEATVCYALASAWDGVASLGVGALIDRSERPERFRLALVGGAVPLGLAFVLAYLPPPACLAGYRFGWVLGGQVVLRSAYALVNIPYLAMSARISADAGDRALVSGGRMLAGTTAAVAVAWGTMPLGRALGGGSGTGVYSMAALGFAGVASAILVAVGLSYRDSGLPQAAPGVSVRRGLTLALSHPAGATLMAAMVAMVVAVTMLDKTVLYYFKYALDDERAGQLALGWMMAASAVAVPGWLAVSRRIGVRRVWLGGIALCLGCLVLFVLAAPRDPALVQVFLVAMQVGIIGLYFALWALIPAAIDHGAARSGVRVEALTYGLAALLQRIAIGLGTLLVGSSLAGKLHAGGDGTGLRVALALLPLGFFAASGVAMLISPLRPSAQQREPA